jgi:ABC-type lipoprotein export system ATPase subunit
MACLLRPTNGKVVVNGKSLADLSVREIADFRKSTMGFVFQAYNLIQSLSALENVIASRMFDEDKGFERAEKLLDRMGLSQRTEHLPIELSGGEQQRIAIARALLNRPAIIFADEPTGNLDTRTGENIISILKDLNREGKTVVIATHNPALLGNSDVRLLSMLDGKVTRYRGNKA